MAADPDSYRDGSGEPGTGWIVEDVACVLRVPSAVAAQKLHVARQPVTRFAATCAAMQDGRLDLRMATRVVESAEQLPDAALPALQAEVLASARPGTGRRRRCNASSSCVTAPAGSRPADAAPRAANSTT